MSLSTTATLLLLLAVLNTKARIYNQWKDSSLNSITDYEGPGEADRLL